MSFRARVETVMIMTYQKIMQPRPEHVWMWGLRRDYIYIYIYTWWKAIYIHTYMCCRVKNGPNFAILCEELVQDCWFFFSLVFCFLFNLLSAWRMRFFKKKAKTWLKMTIFMSKTGPLMLRNILGLIFVSCLDQFLTFKLDNVWSFGCFESDETTIL